LNRDQRQDFLAENCRRERREYRSITGLTTCRSRSSRKSFPGSLDIKIATPLFENSEELWLKVREHCCDFIEEDCAFMGQFTDPRFLGLLRRVGLRARPAPISSRRTISIPGMATPSNRACRAVTHDPLAGRKNENPNRML
jgi:hypothetical protein